MATFYSPSPVAPVPPVGALFTAQGLNAVYLGQPSYLRLRLAHPDARGSVAGGTTGAFTIALDVAAAGAALPASLALAVPGGALPVADPAKLTWQWWATGEALEVELPELTFEGEPGLRAVPLTVSNGSPEPIRLTLPLMCLRPAANSGLPPGRVMTAVRQATLAGAGEGEVGQGAVGLRINYPAVPAAAATPAFYLLMSEGLLPGQNALTTPGAADAMQLSVEEEAAWQVTRLPDFSYPAWRLEPRAGQEPTAGSLDVQLRELRLRHPARGHGHLLVYSVGVPGAADGGQVVSLRWPEPTQTGENASDVSIVRFEADHTTLNIPGAVRLSWLVRNADYVTISGLGKVPAEGKDRAVVVEETTTFVLMAYGTGLSQLESRTLQVEVSQSKIVPKGTILLWGGQLTDVPPGWALCDGNKGRPDLRDRFVLGASDHHQPHTRGDADTHTHTLERTVVIGRTNEAGQHAHKMPLGWYTRYLKEGNYTGIDVNRHDVRDDYSQQEGQHSHEVVVTIPAYPTGSSDSANRPAWYALCYIIKL